MKFIDKIPFSFLLVITVFMLGAPFVPEPHLVEKMRMLVDGTLTRALDIFDVFWHLLPQCCSRRSLSEAKAINRRIDGVAPEC